MLHIVALFSLGLLPAQATEDLTEKPDLWTCGAQDWGPNEARCYPVTEGVADGKSAVSLNFCHWAEHYLAYPKWRNANWDLSGQEFLEFKVKVQSGTGWRGPNPTVYLRSQEGPFVRLSPAKGSLMERATPNEWVPIRVPLKPSPDWERFVWLGGNLRKVDFIELSFSGGGPTGVGHSVQVDGVRFSSPLPAYKAPNEQAADLDVLIIERAPLYERYILGGYDGGKEIGRPTNLNAKHQPAKGELVTWTATVQNKGKAASAAAYEWLVDGKAVQNGDLKELKPREKATFSFKWTWDPADHDITFRVKPKAEDYCPTNDSLTIRNTALMYKFMIERGLIARMEQKTNMMGSYSMEDWLQGQLRFMNQLFAGSTYPFAPKGITQRVMAGYFEYVDDGYIPTLGGGPYFVGEKDPRLDGGRGCTALDDPWNSGAGAPCFMNFIGRPDDAWLHELSHQIGVIDDYQFITEPENNKINGVGFNYRNGGMMGGGEVGEGRASGKLYSLYSPSNVLGLNATKGKRRGFFGEYLYQMPQKCRLQIVDADGKPIAGAEIKVYQTKERMIQGPPDSQGRTDAKGVFALPNKPIPGGPFTTATGLTLHDNPFGIIHVVGFNGVMLVTVRAGGKDLYGFTSVPEFNVAYARGEKELATIPVTVKVKGDERWGYGRW